MVVLAGLIVVAGVIGSGVWHSLSLPDVLAVPVVPLDLSTRSMTTDETVADVGDVIKTVAGPNAVTDPPGYLRIPHPKLPDGPRRVGIQAGHWKTEQAPPELGVRIPLQTGTSWNGITEWETNLDIAQRVAGLLRKQGIVVDVLPTTIPEGYIADAFVALHADGDGTGENSGFKLAHGSRRGLYEDALQRAIRETYAVETGLSYDGEHVTRNMLAYYAVSWTRYRHATSPFTPSVILEMGYLSNDDDRELMIDKANVVAVGIANGIVNFLSAHPRSELFAKDLLIPPAPILRFPAPPPAGVP